MRKFRRWRSSMRQTRSQTLRQRQKEQEQEQHAIDDDVAADPTSLQSQSSKPSVLSIFLNDFTDADNEAAALLWAWSLELNPESITKGIYIAEPRHVNVGYYMTARDFGACISLVAKLSPSPREGYTPLRIVLSGSVPDEDYIKNPQLKADGRCLTDRERDLLRRCIRPKDGDKEDAIKHARLVSMDYLTTMKARSSLPFDAYIDIACLEHLESPINLKTHYHDELIARSAEELEKFQKITEMSTDDEERIENRRDELRNWYNNALDRKQREFGGQCPIKDMKDYSALYDEIRNHDRTIFLGGASLTIVADIIKNKPDLAKKVEYYQQGGTFDSKFNILGNPLNFALNTKAAKYVFADEQKGKLGKLVLVSTTTTQKLQFTAKGLTKLHPAVGVRAVGFFGRLDPWELLSPKEKDEAGNYVPMTSEDFLSWRAEHVRSKFCEDDNFKGKKAVMADLVAFLICFTRVFDDGDFNHVIDEDNRKVGKKEIQVAMTEGSGSMVMKENESGPIKSMMLDPPEDGQNPVLVDDTSKLVEEAMKTFYIP